MGLVAHMTNDKPIVFWSAKAHETLHKKLGSLNLAWVGALIEVTEPKQKTI